MCRLHRENLDPKLNYKFNKRELSHDYKQQPIQKKKKIAHRYRGLSTNIHGIDTTGWCSPHNTTNEVTNNPRWTRISFSVFS